MTTHIVVDGRDKIGKTTQVELLYQYLISKGYKVLKTREPGSPLAPVSMELRKYMLDSQYADQMTMTARELISQAIRSIHIEKVIMPAIGRYDYIVQDRGILSGFAYGQACGNDLDFLRVLSRKVCEPYVDKIKDLYDYVLVFTTGSSNVMSDRTSDVAQEFTSQDFIEAQGDRFMDRVEDNMVKIASTLGEFNATIVDVTDKDIPAVFKEVCKILNI